MTPRVTVAVATRVLQQVRRDHRTLAMLLVVPGLLLCLLGWVYADLPAQRFDALAPGLLAVIPFIVMFLVSSVTTLRERSSGTLERLLALPMGRGDFLLGYALAFGLLAIGQALVAVGACLTLGLEVAGPTGWLVVVAIADALLGVALGLGVSAFAATEFQAVQFMPALVIPQLLVCGLLVPRASLPAGLEEVAALLPLSYAVSAMQAVVASPTAAGVGSDLAVVVGFAVALLALGGLTLRRRTP